LAGEVPPRLPLHQSADTIGITARARVPSGLRRREAAARCHRISALRASNALRARAGRLIALPRRC
jgi:hypothetical protein